MDGGVGRGCQWAARTDHCDDEHDEEGVAHGKEGGGEGGEDLLLDLATGSALGGATGLGCLCSLCGTTGLLRFGRAAAALSSGAGRLAGDQGSELGLDLLDLVKKAFLALSKLDKVLQRVAANVCDIHNKVSYFISLTG